MSEGKKSRESIIISFSGEAVDDGEMDVHNLASSMQAFANLCQEAYATLTEGVGGPELSVKIKSNFRSGSFHLDTVLEHILETYMVLHLGKYAIGRLLFLGQRSVLAVRKKIRDRKIEKYIEKEKSIEVTL